MIPRIVATPIAPLAIPDSRLEQIPDSRTFISEDQPQRLAELVADFASPPGE